MKLVLLLLSAVLIISVYGDSNDVYYRGQFNAPNGYPNRGNFRMRNQYYDDSGSFESDEYYVDFRLPHETEDTLVLVNVVSDISRQYINYIIASVDFIIKRSC